MMRLFIKYKADVNCEISRRMRRYDIRSCLERCLVHEDPNMVNLLIKNGANDRGLRFPYYEKDPYMTKMSEGKFFKKMVF